MKRLISSFRARFILTAVLLGSLLMMAALYTTHRVGIDVERGVQLLSGVQETDSILQRLILHLQKLKTALYRHAVNFDRNSAGQAMQELVNIHTEIKRLMESQDSSLHRQLASETKQLEVQVRKLDNLVSQLLRIQMQPATRYPAAAIMLNELQPGNRRFAATVDLMLDEAAGHTGKAWRQVWRLLNDIRYYWAQNISTVRVFVANRSGTFGEPEKVLPTNIETQRVYHDQVDKLLTRLEKLGKDLDVDIDFSNMIIRLKRESAHYRKTFARVVKSFMSPQWRKDAALLNRFVSPLISRSFETVTRMRRITSRLIGIQIGRSLSTSQTLSGFIWAFVAIVFVVLLIGYLVFQRTIRKPLLDVVDAMNRQARGETDELPVMKYYTNESELLVSAFNHMKREVGTRQSRLEAILRNAAEGIIILDSEGRIETFNTAAEFLFRTRAEHVIGEHVGVLTGESDPERALCEWVGNPDQAGMQRELLVRRYNEDCYLSIRVSSFSLDGKRFHISIVSDVTEQKAMLERLQALADLDSLTGLHNRRYFIEELDRVVDQAGRSDSLECALFFIDLDNFKLINDTLGHVVGDKVLVSVAVVLRGNTRKSDVLSRLGGDEFAVLAYDVNSHQALSIADKFRSSLRDNKVYESGKALDVGCSIGVTMIDGSKSRDDLMLEADYACHLAKRSGRNRVHLYSDDDHKNKAEMLETMSWVQQINHALQNDRFVLAAQPIVETGSGRVVWTEMLLRLRGEDEKLVMPFGFIGSAERFDMMKEIDTWVITHAIHMLRQRMSSASYVSSISINLSAQSIGDDDVFQHIRQTIRSNGVRPDLIMFEITETVAISHMEDAFRFLRQLRNMGCKTALDDFGSGYSSFGYLKELPVDMVKIDGSFVRNIESDKLSAAMVKSMNDIAHVMGKQTVAEFVETREAMHILTEMGVDFCQGFYLGRPEIIGNAADVKDIDGTPSCMGDPE